MTLLLTPSRAAELAGPDWLRARRAAAAEAAAASPRPSSDAELWRYSRIDELDLDRFAPVVAGGSATPAALAGTPAGSHPDAAAVVVVHDGEVVRVDCSDALVSQGVFVGRLLDHPDAPALLGAAMAEPTDLFAMLNDAFALDPIAVVVPRGVEVAGPVVVVHTHGTADVAVFPRLVVRAADGARVAVVEYRASDDASRLVAPVVELCVGRDAHVGYLDVQQLGRRSWQIASQVSTVASSGSLVSSTAAFGGDYARARVDCRLVGRGATGTLSSLYFGDGEQMLDFRTFQDHRERDTTSRLLFKGAVDDASKSVYTGLIRVRPGARGTNAFQTNRNIKLSDDAWAESVPNLEIENNDVHCSHASTVGPIDEEQRFYLESRGVPTPVADRLIVAGFFGEVIDQVPVPGAAPYLRRAVAEKLEGSAS